MMQVATHRVVVIGTLLSAFMWGLHIPTWHEVIEHGATPRMDVAIVTVLFAIGTLVGGWTLLRSTRSGRVA